MAEAEVARLKADLEAKDNDMQFLMEQLLGARQEIHEAHAEADEEREKRGLSKMLTVCTYWRWAWKGKAFVKWKEEVDVRKTATEAEKHHEEALNKVRSELTIVTKSCEEKLKAHTAEAKAEALGDAQARFEVQQAALEQAAEQRMGQFHKETTERVNNKLEAQRRHTAASVKIVSVMFTSRTSLCQKMAFVRNWAQNTALSKKDDEWQTRLGPENDIVADLRQKHVHDMELECERHRVSLRSAKLSAEEKHGRTIIKQRMLLKRSEQAQATLIAKNKAGAQKLRAELNLAQRAAIRAAASLAEQEATSSVDEANTVASLEKLLLESKEETKSLQYELSSTRQQFEKALQIGIDSARLRGSASINVVQMLLGFRDDATRKQLANMRSNFVDYKHSLAVEMEGLHGQAAQDRDTALARVKELEPALARAEEELAVQRVLAAAGQQALHHMENTFPPMIEDMQTRIDHYVIDDELETVRCRLLAVKQMVRWVRWSELHGSGIGNAVRLWNAQTRESAYKVSSDNLTEELALIKGGRSAMADKAQQEIENAVSEAKRAGSTMGGYATARATLSKRLWGNASQMFRHWYIMKNEKTIERRFKQEYQEKYKRDAELKAAVDQEHAANMARLTEHIQSLEADFQHFLQGAIDSEAELKLLTGSDIKIGATIVKSADPNHDVIERGDALTMLEMRSALQVADGMLCNMKIDVQKSFEDDSDSDSDAEDDQTKEPASQTATADYELALNYLEEEVASRKVIEVELLRMKFQQGLLLLVQSSAVGGFQTAQLHDMFTWWKTFAPQSKRERMGCMAGIRRISAALEDWKRPALMQFFERWFFSAQDLLRKRLMYAITENYRILRGRMTWREKQTIMCQAQLTAVIAERDTIADYQTELIGAHIRDHSENLLGSQDILRDNDMARAVAGANACAQSAESIARANIGKVWPEADRFQIAVKHIESALKVSDDPKEMDHMLTRWCEEVDMDVPDVHSRKLDETMKTLASMVIEGKDWPLEDCLADGENWAMKGTASQSILKGYNPFSPKEPVKISENIEEEYGPPGTFVFQPGKSAIETVPKDAKEVWAAHLRQKAAMEAKERMHRKEMAETKATHEAAVKKIIMEVDDLVEAKVGAANNSGASTASSLKEELDNAHKAQEEMEARLTAEKDDAVSTVAAGAFREAMQAWQAAVHMGIHRFSLSELQWGCNRWRQSVMTMKFNAKTQSSLNEDAIFGSRSYVPKPARSTADDLIAQLAAAEAMWNVPTPKSEQVKT